MKTKYIINPSFRFHTWCLVVEWHEVPYNILQSESQYPCEGRSIYAKGKQCQVMAQTNEKKIDFYYHPETVFENRNVQAWLRNIIKNSVLAIADIELPKRLHYWEKEKNLYAKQVIVKKLKRRNIWGQCSIYKQIFLPPKLVVFPLELVDEVMLHEMTHLKYMHHRKQFWDYFSLLLGKDAKLYKIKENEFFTKYDDKIEFLLK